MGTAEPSVAAGPLGRGYDRRMRERVLFLCTHNSARSQMAEGMLRAWGGDRFDAYSAGVQANVVAPLAIRAMDEIGIDISDQMSKRIETFDGQAFDRAVTVCADASESCPYFPRAGRQLHWSFEDPSAARGTAAQQLAVFRRVRDQIAERIRVELLGSD